MRARIVVAAAAAMTSEHQIINFIIITSLFPWADSLDPRWPADFSLMTTATEKNKTFKNNPKTPVERGKLNSNSFNFVTPRRRRIEPLLFPVNFLPLDYLFKVCLSRKSRGCLNAMPTTTPMTLSETNKSSSLCYRAIVV